MYGPPAMDPVHAFALGASLTAGLVFWVVEKGSRLVRLKSAVLCFLGFGFGALLLGYFVSNLFTVE